MDEFSTYQRTVERRANPHGAGGFTLGEAAATLLDFAGLVFIGLVMFAFGAGFAGLLQAVLP